MGLRSSGSGYREGIGFGGTSARGKIWSKGRSRSEIGEIGVDIVKGEDKW